MYELRGEGGNGDKAKKSCIGINVRLVYISNHRFKVALANGHTYHFRSDIFLLALPNVDTKRGEDRLGKFTPAFWL